MLYRINPLHILFVADRLAWIGRCAATYAHDLGNIMLFTEVVDCDAAQAASASLRRNLLQ